MGWFHEFRKSSKEEDNAKSSYHPALRYSPSGNMV